MKTISLREFRNSCAAVMDAVEAGETFHITRNGVEVAELRPIPRRQKMTSEELVALHAACPAWITRRCAGKPIGLLRPLG